MVKVEVLHGGGDGDGDGGGGDGSGGGGHRWYVLGNVTRITSSQCSFHGDVKYCDEE